MRIRASCSKTMRTSSTSCYARALSDLFIAEAFGDVISFRQSPAMTEEIYRSHLWNKTLQCNTVSWDRRLKSLFLKEQFPVTCAQVRNYVVTNSQVGYLATGQYAQAIGETHRASRFWRVLPCALPDPNKLSIRNVHTVRGRCTLSFEFS